MRAFQNEHVILLAAGVQYPRDERDKEAAPNFLDIRRLIRAKIVSQPCAESLSPIPNKAVEVVANGVECALARSQVNGLVAYVFAYFCEPSVFLHPHLQLGYVVVTNGTWQYFIGLPTLAAWIRQGLDKNRRAKHFIEGETLRNLRRPRRAAMALGSELINPSSLTIR